jgi:mycofactocin precursor
MIAPARPEVILVTGEHSTAEATATDGDDIEETEELLVEEISIDGMCGVY